MVVDSLSDLYVAEAAIRCYKSLCGDRRIRGSAEPLLVWQHPSLSSSPPESHAAVGWHAPCIVYWNSAHMQRNQIASVLLPGAFVIMKVGAALPDLVPAE